MSRREIKIYWRRKSIRYGRVKMFRGVFTKEKLKRRWRQGYFDRAAASGSDVLG
jgi:hypothetical protein